MVSSLACAATTPLWAFAVGHKATTSDLPPDPDQLLISAGPTVEPFRCLPTSFSFLREIALSPDGSRLAVRAGTPDHFLSIVDVATGVESARVQVTQGGTGWELCWAPDASVVVVVEDGGFSFRSPTDLREIGWLAIEYPASIAFAPSGAFIALGTWSGGVVAPWPDFKEALGVRDASSSPPAP